MNNSKTVLAVRGRGFARGEEHHDWKQLGAGYFIAPWEKKRFEAKKAGRLSVDTVGT